MNGRNRNSLFHANPNKASELGRMGGRKNRRVTSGDEEPLPALDSALAVRKTVSRLIEDIYSGKLPPRTASGLAQLLNLQLRAIETTDLERRIARIEKLFEEAQVEENRAPELSFGDLPMIVKT